MWDAPEAVFLKVFVIFFGYQLLSQIMCSAQLSNCVRQVCIQLNEIALFHEVHLCESQQQLVLTNWISSGSVPHFRPVKFYTIHPICSGCFFPQKAFNVTK